MEEPFSKKYYSVYWYPTIFHQEKVHREINPRPIDISDNSLNKRYYLTIEEEKVPDKKEAYHLHYYLSKTKKELPELKTGIDCISFTFHYIRHSRNGFVKYWYDRDALMQSYWSQFDDQEKKDIKENLTSVLKKLGINNPSNFEIENYPVDRILLNCYHHSKNFYHEHEVQDEADGKLEAYYFTLNPTNGKRHYLINEPDISHKNHDVINWYIDQFEKQFVKYAKKVSITYRFYNDRLKLYEKYQYESKEVIDSQDKHKIDLLLILLRWENELNRQVEQSNFDIIHNSEKFKQFKQDCLAEFRGSTIEVEKKEITNLLEQIPNFRIRLLHNRLKLLETSCGNASTEYTYCKTLIESKYNEKYDYSLPVSESEIKELIAHYENNSPCDAVLLEKDNCRKKAFNIRNCIRYIEGVRQKCTIWENELSQELIKKVGDVSASVGSISQSNQDILKASQKSSRRSELLGWISVMLGFWGVGFALRDFHQASTNFRYGLWTPIVLGGILFIYGIIRVRKEARNDRRPQK